MADYITVPIKVPVISLEVSGEFSRYKKPSGLENLILTAIGTPSLRKETWGSFFNRLEIPSTMEPLFESVFDELYDNDVIDSYRFDLEDRINETEFTETGRDLFEQGRVKQEPTTFSENIYYLPYSNYFDEAYTFSPKTSSMNGFDKERYSEIVYDPERLSEFIDANKKKLGADSGDIILQIDVDNPEILCADMNVKLSFDEASGDFLFESDIDPNFIKGYYTIEDLIPQNSEIHRTPDFIKVKSIGSVPDNWESFRYVLPGFFGFKGTLKVFDSDYVDISGAYPVKDMGCQFADIISSTSGRSYIFVKKKASILGIEGEVEYTALISRPLTETEIRVIIDKVIESKKKEGLQQFIDIMPVLEMCKDNSHVAGVIRDYLSSCKDPNECVMQLKKIKSNWSPMFGDIVEGALCDRSMDIDEIVIILRSNNLKVSGERIAESYSSDTDDKNMKLADKLFPVVSNKGIITAQLGIRDALVRCVLDGKTVDSKSIEMMSLKTLADSFTALKKAFKVKDVNDYDLTNVDESSISDINKVYDAANKALKTCEMLMIGSSDYQVVTDYMDMFQNLVEIYGTEPPLERLTGYYFGFALRRKIEKMLRSVFGKAHDLSNMIDMASEKKYITKEDRDELHRMRDYGNKCVHPTGIDIALNNKDKQKWVSTINRIEKELSKVKKVNE